MNPEYPARGEGRGASSKGRAATRHTLPFAPFARRQAGFALPMAIFLMVIIGALAAYLINVTRSNLTTHNLELEGERTYQAAQAGMESGIYAVRVGGACATQNVGFTGELARFTASVRCTPHTANEGGVTVTLYELISIACNQPSAGACPNANPTLPEYVERHVRAVVEGGP